MTYPVLIAGEWRPAQSVGTFHAENPATGEPLSGEYPVSAWADCDSALDAAVKAARALRETPVEKRAAFLNAYADRLDAKAKELASLAHQETALPASPRFTGAEIPRTTGQLRQGAAAALEGSWALATIDTKLNIRSWFAPIGPVVVFGPNNFPFAFNAVSGGDMVAAIAAGNPVIAKGHPLHPGTTRLLAEEAVAAIAETGVPPAILQLLYHLEPQSGLRLVSDPRVGASAFTGSRAGGLALKAAADAAGKPIYLEMSSINPVVVLPGALAERGGAISEEFAGSCMLGAGQFCTNPGLVLLIAGASTEAFIASVKATFEKAALQPMLSGAGLRSFISNVDVLEKFGAERLTPPPTGSENEKGYRGPNTLLRVSAREFLGNPAALQTEAFGPSSLLVVADNVDESLDVLSVLEGSLTGTLYSASDGRDESAYAKLEPRLRERVGRLLNDKMPTGVAVSPAMNHGGPFPSTGHPGFTSVGIPASLGRFASLHCYDNVRQDRLPAALRDKNPNGKMWRLVDGRWSQSDV